MQESNGFDVKELLLVLRGRLRWILLATVLGGAAACVVILALIPPQYVSSVSLYVNNLTQAGNTPDALNLSDINASQKLVGTYIVIIEDDEVLDQVAEALMADLGSSRLRGVFPLEETPTGPVITAEALRKSLSLRAVNATEVLRIEAKTRDPEISARICALITEIAPPVLQRVVKAGSVEIVGEPKPAIKPTSPSLARGCVIGCLLGGLGAALWFIFRYLLDTSIKDEEDFKKHFDLPVLGEIPVFADADAGQHADPRVNDGTPSHILEAYKLVRANLLFSLATQESRAVVVTSALPGEGKSAACANLALTMAQTGARVLLIDADLRKAMQHRIFRLPNAKGLTNLLVGTGELKNLLHTDEDTGLDIITSGRLPPNPSELLGSGRMQALLRELSGSYEYIFVDSPPVSAVSDALILSNLASGLLLVARQGRCSYEDVSKTVASIKFAQARILGVVINAVKPGGRKRKSKVVEAYDD